MRKLAIVGTHPKTRADAPYDDLEWDIWAFNESASQMERENNEQWLPRVDAIFQMHDRAIYSSLHNRADKHHWNWMQREHGDLRIIMQDYDMDVPNAWPFPLEDMSDELLGAFRQGLELERRDFYTSSISMAIALAIYEQYDWIKVFGIEMTSDTEYSYQRDCVAFWTGYALGRGILVDFYGGDTIWERPIYGYEGQIATDSETLNNRAIELREVVLEARERAETAKKKLNRSYNNGKLPDCIMELMNANTELGTAEGAMQEIVRYGAKVLPLEEEFGIAIIDRNEYEGAGAQAKKQMEEFGQEVYRTAGHIDTIINAWMNSKDPAVKVNLQNAIDNHCNAAYNSGKAQGIYNENFRLAADIDEKIRAAGGEKAAALLKHTGNYSG